MLARCSIAGSAICIHIKTDLSSRDRPAVPDHRDRGRKEPTLMLRASFMRHCAERRADASATRTIARLPAREARVQHYKSAVGLRRATVLL